MPHIQRIKKKGILYDARMNKFVNLIDILTRSFGLWIFLNILAIITIEVVENTFLSPRNAHTIFDLTVGLIVWNIIISLMLNIVLRKKFFLLKGRAMLKSVGILAMFYSAFVIVLMFLAFKF